MHSGVEIDQGVIDMYTEVKKAKTSKPKLSGCIIKFNDDNTKLVVEETLEKCEDTPYSKLMEKLKSNECRFGFVCVEFADNEGFKDSVLVFYWAGERAPVKLKMPASSSFEALKRKCEGAKLYLQMNDNDDKKLDYICDKISKKPVTVFEGRAVEKDPRTSRYHFVDDCKK